MKKLFIKQKHNNPYKAELLKCMERIKGKFFVKPLMGLDIEYLKNNHVDVVVSNGLPREWYYILRGMNIVAITLDDLDKYGGYADIVIDCRNNHPHKYFTGPEFSLNNSNFDINDVVNLIKILEWDSEYFGYNVAYLSCMHLTDNIYQRIGRFIGNQKVTLVEYLCNCHDNRSVIVAEKNGFHFVDIRLTFSRRIAPFTGLTLPPGIGFAKAGKRDIPALKKISKDIYIDSRYYFDDKFNRDQAMEFYQGWVEKGVLGTFDSECWCFYRGKKPFAFCTVKYLKDGRASIGLVGLDSRYQGQGYGKLLLRSVINTLADHGVDQVDVVTQGRNYSAQVLYQSVGFRTKTTQLWYHKWISGGNE